MARPADATNRTLDRPTGAEPGGAIALGQIAELIGTAVGGKVSLSTTAYAFRTTTGTPGSGILSASGELRGDLVIVSFEVARAPRGVRIEAGEVFKQLATLSERTRIGAATQDPDTTTTSQWIELRVHATPLSPSREAALVAEIEGVARIAQALQSEIPVVQTDADVVAKYDKLSKYLEPVHPLSDDSLVPTPLLAWSHTTLAFLAGSASIAVSADCPISGDHALAVLAREARGSGGTFGLLKVGHIGADGLVDLCQRAPGRVVVPAVRAVLGSNPYDAAGETRAFLGTLERSGVPAVFTGTYPELQAVFHGGQGGAGNPLVPIICRLPAPAPLEDLARFAVRQTARRHGGIRASVEERAVSEIVTALAGRPPADQRHLLPMVASWRVAESSANSGSVPGMSTAAYVDTLSGLSETFVGLSDARRAERSPEVQTRFAEGLGDPGLASFLKSHLVGQDGALDRLTRRLVTECLTRPSHQPIRYCAQGTPATGKSHSAALLGQRLGVPYVNIDAASMPDHHTAASQLLGSGRGIVGSYQAGRLEQVAKHHTGAVVEISDLDHAVASVRAAFADLFLQVLETGEVQSAKGAMISCANLILAFTMNLPDGQDERIWQSVGFDRSRSQEDVTDRVTTEIKEMLSGAFLSRVGTPIVFKPLDDEALAVVVSRAIRDAVMRGAASLGEPLREVVIEDRVGQLVVQERRRGTVALGARQLLEIGRRLAAEALMTLRDDGASLKGQAARVGHTSGGRLIIHTTP